MTGYPGFSVIRMILNNENTVEHFEKALGIDPSNSDAQRGIAEAKTPTNS